MLSRISKRTQVSGNGGFTLIELLVVVIIIGILAAIAIPMYLKQREKGWHANVQSDLRNAAVAQESYFTDMNKYADSLALIDAAGFNKSSNIDFTDPIAADSVGYCMQAVHKSGGSTYHFNSADGEPKTGGCAGP